MERSNSGHWSHHCSCIVGHSMVERKVAGMNLMVRDYRGGMNTMVNTMLGNQRSCMNIVVNHGMWSQGNSWTQVRGVILGFWCRCHSLMILRLWCYEHRGLILGFWCHWIM